MSKLETNIIDNISGSSTLKLGDTNATTLDFDTGITSITNMPAAFKNTPYFLMQGTGSNQVVSDATQTKVTFQSAVYDSDSGVDLTNNEYVIPTGKGGFYKINASLGGYNNSNKMITFIVYLKFTRGATTTELARLTQVDYATQGRHMEHALSQIYEFQAGDKIFLNGLVDVTAGNAEFRKDGSSCFLGGFRLNT